MMAVEQCLAELAAKEAHAPQHRGTELCIDMQAQVAALTYKLLA